ncbi:16487_t:CDS:2, partial [Acaulospora colombiana]
MPSEIKFVRIKGELAIKLGRRFELFCCELLMRHFEELDAIVTHTGIESTSGHCFGSERSSQLSVIPSVALPGDLMMNKIHVGANH